MRLTPRFGANSDVVPNQSVVIQVPRGQRREVVTVAKDAIVSRQTGPIVFVFQQGRVRPAQVRIGEGFGSKFEIRSGLRPGMKVVVRGNEMLRPGQNVRVARSGPGGGGGPGGGNPQAGAIIQSLSAEERQKFFAMSGPEKGAFIRAKLAERNARGGPQGARQGAGQGPRQDGGQARGPGGGGPGGGQGGRNPQAGVIIRSLSDEERQKFFAMSGPEKGAFIRAKLAERNAGGGPQGAAPQGARQGGGQAARGPGGGGPGGGGPGGGQGGRGPSPEARAVIQGLSDEERRKFFAMPRAERRAFIQQKLSRQ